MASFSITNRTDYTVHFGDHTKVKPHKIVATMRKIGRLVVLQPLEEKVGDREFKQIAAFDISFPFYTNGLELKRTGSTVECSFVLSVTGNFFMGAAAACFSKVVTTPVENLKLHSQLQVLPQEWTWKNLFRLENNFLLCYFY
jgi:hypothetical protein